MKVNYCSSRLIVVSANQVGSDVEDGEREQNATTTKTQAKAEEWKDMEDDARWFVGELESGDASLSDLDSDDKSSPQDVLRRRHSKPSRPRISTSEYLTLSSFVPSLR